MGRNESTKSYGALAFEAPEVISAIQNKKLQEHLEYISAYSPFYRSKLPGASVDLRAIKSVKDIALLPITTKQELQADNDSFYCVGKEKLIDYSSTSGTEGKPVSVALTEQDLDRLARNEAESFLTAGHQSGNLYQLALTLDRQFMAGLAYFLGLRQLGAGIIRLGPGNEASQWDHMLQFKPTALVVVPSFLLRLLNFAEQHGIDYTNTGVERIICIGESIRKPDFSLNSLGLTIASKWGVKLYGTYASTEMQTAFTECEHGLGGHLQPDLMLAEVLDETGQDVQEGNAGELTVTPLGVQGMPLLRYRTGDICQLHSAPCPCGRNTPRIGPIIGRKHQMLKVQGTTLYPPAITEILSGLDWVQRFVVEATTTDTGTDSLRVLIQTAESPTDRVANLRSILRSQIRITPEVVLVPATVIEQLQGTTVSRKAKLFVDNRTHQI